VRRPLAAAIALALLAPSLLWGQRAYTIERFDAGIVVNRDASIDVTETITVNFVGAWNGVYRSIPVDYRSPQGFNWTLRLELLSATDGSGNVLRTEASRERHYLKYKMWIPGAENATRVVILKYRATNGLRFFEDHDELYWNVTGDEWDVPLGAVSARIELPAGASGLRATAFTGSYGATTRDAAVDTTGNVVRITMDRPLAYREGVTAVVGWDKGVVREPSTSERFFAGLADNWALLIPLPVFFGMLSLWRRRGRDPDELPVHVRYEPPDGLTPAEVGTLVDQRPDMRDITASVVDLAVKGYLRIEEQEEKKLLGLVTDREYVFHRVRDRSAWGDLADHERRLMHGRLRPADRARPLWVAAGQGAEPLAGLRRRGGRGVDSHRPHPGREVRHRAAAVHHRRAGECRDRGVLRLAHAGAHGEGRPHGRAGEGVRRVPGAGGEGSLRARRQDARDVRAIPAVRDGAAGGGPLGARVRGHLHRAADVVRRQLSRHLQRGALLVEPGRPLLGGRDDDVVDAALVGRLGVQRRVLGRRLRGRGRRRVLTRETRRPPAYDGSVKRPSTDR
jgi:hypothetical protein